MRLYMQLTIQVVYVRVIRGCCEIWFQESFVITIYHKGFQISTSDFYSKLANSMLARLINEVSLSLSLGEAAFAELARISLLIQ